MERNALVDTLEIVKPALSKEELLPILTHFCFTGDEVFAYNDIIAIKSVFQTNFSGALSGEILLNLLKISKGEELLIRQMNDVVQFTVRDESGRTNSFKQPLLDKDEFLCEFPDENELPKQYIEIDEEFIAGIKKCLRSVSSQFSMKSNISGVTLDSSKSITLYSTDVVSISRVHLSTPLSKNQSPILRVLPKAFCDALLHLWSKKSPNNVPKVYFGDSFLLADFGEHSVLSKVLNTKPKHFKKDYTDIIEDDMGEYYEIPEYFTQAIAKARILLKRTGKTILRCENNELSLETDAMYGSSSDSCQVNKQEDIEYMVDPDIIGLCLKDVTHMYVTDRAIIFNGGDYTYYVAVGEED